MKNNYYLELEELKNENYKLRKELAKYKSSNENQFLNDNLEILIKPIESFDLSVRTLNCLKNEKVNNLGDLIQLSENFLLRSVNFGRKSLEELKNILRYYNLSFNTIIDDWPPSNLKEKIQYLKDKEIDELEVDEKSLFVEIESILDKNELFVIKKRFWENKTLHDIGVLLNITRERVRQLEFKSLRKVKVIKKNYLISFLKKNKEKIFQKYSENSNIITHKSLKKILTREKLPRMLPLISNQDILIKIAIKILHENIYKYFDKEYIKFQHGWEK